MGSGAAAEEEREGLGVILTARRAVFIWGETDMMVPCRMVPVRFDG